MFALLHLFLKVTIHSSYWRKSQNEQLVASHRSKKYCRIRQPKLVVRKGTVPRSCSAHRSLWLIVWIYNIFFSLEQITKQASSIASQQKLLPHFVSHLRRLIVGSTNLLLIFTRNDITTFQYQAILAYGEAHSVLDQT